MRRGLGYVLAWGLATVVAVTGSWVGLQPLLAATSPELPTPLSAAQVREAAPGPSASPTPSPARSSSPTPSPSTTGPASAAPSHTPATTSAPSSGAKSHEAPSAPPVTTELPPPLPATSNWRELPDEAGFERTFIVRGGEAVFRVSRRSVEVVEHTAYPGYTVEVTRWSRSSLILSFESLGHTSRIWVMWRNGPYAEVTETV